MLLLAAAAQAADPAPTLAALDRILADHGGARAPIADPRRAFCAVDGLTPGGAKPVVAPRAFLCRGTEDLGDWDLKGLRANPGEPISAYLGLRRFPSPAAARSARENAIARYGAGSAFLEEGAIGWCYADVVWQGDLVWTLEYACMMDNLSNLDSLAAVRRLLLSAGDPTHGAVGMRASSGGWTWLTDAASQKVVVPASERYTRFARVRGVAADDTLAVRDVPMGPAAQVLARLPPDARCVPIAYQPETGPRHHEAERPWWRIQVGDVLGWSSSAYLELEPVGACP